MTQSSTISPVVNLPIDNCPDARPAARSLSTLALLIGSLTHTLVASAQTNSPDPVGQFTGAPTRIVWVQDNSPGNRDIQAQGTQLQLMGYDSLDGQHERPLLQARSNYARPLLSPNGRQVIFTDRVRGRVMLLDWGSQQPKTLARGAALCTWHDHLAKTDWVVVGQRIGQAGSYFYRNLTRIRLDNPAVSIPLWSKTRISPDNFQLSRNGRFAAGVFPWPNGGLVQLDSPSHSLTHLGKGCWASLAPDNSRLAWVFDGPHRHLKLSAPDDGPKWKVAVGHVARLAKTPSLPTTGPGDEMFHPRWSNHVRFLVLTGPYNRKGPVNAVSGGGPQVEIYLARFHNDFRTIQSAIRISNNSRPDFFPDAWIANGPASQVPDKALVTTQPITKTDVHWPPDVPKLIWAFQDTRRPLQLPANSLRPEITCRARLSGRTRPGRSFQLQLSNGNATISPTDPGLVAHWNKHHTLTISMLLTVTPANSKRPGVLLAIEPPANTAKPDDTRKLQLTLTPQSDGTRLALSLSKTTTLNLANLKPETPTHLVITLDPKGVSLRIDGQPARRLTPPFTAALNQLHLPPDSQVTWGNNASKLRPCEALISHITVSANVLNNAQSQPLCDAANRVRKSLRPARRVVVRARCVDTSPVPRPTQIAPYRRALVYHHYRIDQVESGKITHPEILVAHWAILDGKLQSSRRPTIGRIVRLVIEPISDHAQLDSERQVMEVERIDLPLFLDVQ